ncbi:hypothetical protein RB195_025820 [Necator americanus]|uniref:Uncharacterized protein n=1 Tax=Necator americanus TaxID=51031 RepID=A0ABR1EU12_NECAM
MLNRIHSYAVPSSSSQQPNITEIILTAEFDELQQNTSNITVEDQHTVGFVEENFPVPSAGFTEMVEAAKQFVHKYLTISEWLNMKKLLRVIKEIGGTRRDTHRAITIYLGRVLSAEKRREIEDRKQELAEKFSGDFRFRL